MGKKAQTSKNIQLTHNLIEYLMNGKNVPKLPKDVSFVPFSQKDNKLNIENEKLLEVLYKEDSPVAKAIEPESKSDDWKITPVNF